MKKGDVLEGEENGELSLKVVILSENKEGLSSIAYRALYLSSETVSKSVEIESKMFSCFSIRAYCVSVINLIENLLVVLDSRTRSIKKIVPRPV